MSWKTAEVSLKEVYRNEAKEISPLVAGWLAGVLVRAGYSIPVELDGPIGRLSLPLGDLLDFLLKIFEEDEFDESMFEGCPAA